MPDHMDPGIVLIGFGADSQARRIVRFLEKMGIMISIIIFDAYNILLLVFSFIIGVIYQKIKV